MELKKDIYLAGAFFSVAEQNFNKELREAIESQFDSLIFLPQFECIYCMGKPELIFKTCKEGIDNCKIMIAILDGTDVDSGTAWEIGYAYSLDKYIIGIRTDFRQRGDDSGLNCMISRSLHALIEEDNITNIKRNLNLIDSFFKIKNK